LEIRVAPDQIVAEAKRWGIENDVGLRVSASGAVTVAASTPRGRQFVEHLASVQDKEPANGNGHAAEADEKDGYPPLHVIQSAEWLDAARLAGEIDAAAASGKRLPAAVALKLARAVLSLNRDAETTGIVVRPVGVEPGSRSD
jgi:hypothetical protein